MESAVWPMLGIVCKICFLFLILMNLGFISLHILKCTFLDVALKSLVDPKFNSNYLKFDGNF
jgi:hypothetical protein